MTFLPLSGYRIRRKRRKWTSTLLGQFPWVYLFACSSPTSPPGKPAVSAPAATALLSFSPRRVRPTVDPREQADRAALYAAFGSGAVPPASRMQLPARRRILYFARTGPGSARIRLLAPGVEIGDPDAVPLAQALPRLTSLSPRGVEWRLESPPALCWGRAACADERVPAMLDGMFSALRGLLDSTSEEGRVSPLRRHLDPERLIVVVEGDPRRLARDLAPFGAPELLVAAPGSPGALLLERLLRAHGGRALWESTGAVLARTHATGASRDEELWVHPDRFLWTRFTPDGKAVIRVATSPEGSWEKDAGGGVHLADEVTLRKRRQDLAASLPMLLMAFARGELPVVSPGPGRLKTWTSAGEALFLEVDAEGRCLSIFREGPSHSSQLRFSAYASFAGRLLPRRITEYQDTVGARSEWTWEGNPSIPPAAFDPPPD